MTDWTVIYKDIGKRLRIARMMRGLTLREVAEAAGCSVSNLSEIERALVAYPVHWLYELADVLDADIDALLPSNTRTAVITTSSTNAALWEHRHD